MIYLALSNQFTGKHDNAHTVLFVYIKHNDTRNCLCRFILQILINIYTIVVKIWIAE